MKLLIVLCSTEPSLDAIFAFLPLAKKRPDTSMAVMDFSKLMGKDSEKENENTLKGVSYCGVPTYFFGSKHLTELNDTLATILPPEWVEKFTKIKPPKEKLDYGWMRNMAYLLGIASGADAIQFFDLDTRPLDNYSKILEVHAKLLEEPDMAAVSGMYFGPKPVTVQMFRTVEGQVGFLRLLKEVTSFDPFNPPVVGGALAVNTSFLVKCPFPMLPATTMSDDLLISFLATLFNVHTQQSNELVEHRHAFNPEHPGGLSPQWIEGYFPRLMRMTALMTIFSEPEIKQNIVDAANGKTPVYAVGDFERKKRVLENELKLVNGISKIAKEESNLNLIDIFSRLDAKAPVVFEEMDLGVAEYLILLGYWPKIVEKVRLLGEDWVKCSGKI